MSHGARKVSYGAEQVSLGFVRIYYYEKLSRRKYLVLFLLVIPPSRLGFVPVTPHHGLEVPHVQFEFIMHLALLSGDLQEQPAWG